MDFKNNEYYVVLFVSRNKDNEGIPNFKQRKQSFIIKKDEGDLDAIFKRFVDTWVEGEMSRIYISVNARKHKEVLKQLQIYLINHPDINLTITDIHLSSLAMKEGTKTTDKFLFDFGIDNEESLSKFCKEIKALGIKEEEIIVKNTPNGYAVVTEHGSDTRTLLEKWPEVSLKRDGFLFLKSEKRRYNKVYVRR